MNGSIHNRHSRQLIYFTMGLYEFKLVHVTLPKTLNHENLITNPIAFFQIQLL